MRVGFSTRCFFVFPLVVSLVFALGIDDSFCTVGSDEAAGRISEADEVLRHAFQAVLDIESAGASLSELLSKLDAAGRTLTEAEAAYALGDFDEASSKAQQCAAVAVGVADEALSLRSSASIISLSKEWTTITFSMIGGLASVLVVSLIWVLSKRSHLGKLSGMKPEAAS